MQVVNSGGKVVWNLPADGVVHISPSSATSRALIGQYRGASFGDAFSENPMQYDVLQVVGPSGAGIFHVDYTGTAYTD